MRQNADQRIHVVLVGGPPETAAALKTELDALHLQTRIVADIGSGQHLLSGRQSIRVLAWWVHGLTRNVVDQVQTIQRIPVPASLCDLLLISHERAPTQLQIENMTHSGGLRTLRWNLPQRRLLTEILNACRRAERRHAQRAGMVSLLDRLNRFQHGVDTAQPYWPEAQGTVPVQGVSEPTSALGSPGGEDIQTKQESLRQAHFGASLKLESHWLILLLVANGTETSGSCTPEMIQTRTGLDGETLNRRLASLEEAGLIEQHITSGKGRSRRFQITPLARERLLQLGAIPSDPE